MNNRDVDDGTSSVEGATNLKSDDHHSSSSLPPPPPAHRLLANHHGDPMLLLLLQDDNTISKIIDKEENSSFPRRSSSIVEHVFINQKAWEQVSVSSNRLLEDVVWEKVDARKRRKPRRRCKRKRQDVEESASASAQQRLPIVLTEEQDHDYHGHGRRRGEQKHTSRVGPEYQAVIQPVGSEALAVEGGTVLWDPIRASQLGNDEAIDTFLDRGEELNVKAMLMEALHRSDYDTHRALKVFYQLHSSLGRDISVEWRNKEQVRKFLEICSSGEKEDLLLACPGRRLERLFVQWARWKTRNPVAYLSLKRARKSAPDECSVCKDGGKLIVCDSCHRTYHLHCHMPRLEQIPVGNKWMCGRCRAVLGKPLEKEPSRPGMHPAAIQRSTGTLLRVELPIRPEGFCIKLGGKFPVEFLGYGSPCGRAVKGYAEKKNLFRVGDEIVSVDGVNCETMKVSQVAKLLREASGFMTKVLQIRRRGSNVHESGRSNSTPQPSPALPKTSNRTLGRTLFVDITLPIRPEGFLIKTGNVEGKMVWRGYRRQQPGSKMGDAERMNAFREGDQVVRVDGVNCESRAYGEIVKLMQAPSKDMQKHVRVRRQISGPNNKLAAKVGASFASLPSKVNPAGNGHVKNGSPGAAMRVAQRGGTHTNSSSTHMSENRIVTHEPSLVEITLPKRPEGFLVLLAASKEGKKNVTFHGYATGINGEPGYAEKVHAFRHNDEIVGIDGVNCEGKTLNDVISLIKSPSSEISKRFTVRRSQTSKTGVVNGSSSTNSPSQLDRKEVDQRRNGEVFNPSNDDAVKIVTVWLDISVPRGMDCSLIPFLVSDPVVGKVVLKCTSMDTPQAYYGGFLENDEIIMINGQNCASRSWSELTLLLRSPGPSGVKVVRVGRKEIVPRKLASVDDGYRHATGSNLSSSRTIAAAASGSPFPSLIDMTLPIGAEGLLVRLGASNSFGSTRFLGYVRGRNNHIGYAEMNNLFRENDEIAFVNGIDCTTLSFTKALALLKDSVFSGKNYVSLLVRRWENAVNSEGWQGGSNYRGKNEQGRSNPSIQHNSSHPSLQVGRSSFSLVDVSLPIPAEGLYLVWIESGAEGGASFERYGRKENGEMAYAERNDLFRKNDEIVMIDDIDCTKKPFLEVIELLKKPSLTGKRNVRVRRCADNQQLSTRERPSSCDVFSFDV